MAAPPYLSLFKLREAPFSSSGGGKFFYPDAERAQTLNMLQHLTQYSEELLLVSGPAGSGKSSLLEQYLARADDDWKVCRVSGTDSADPGVLFLTAARCFGLHTEGLTAETVLDALREHLNQLQQTMTPVLVVDAAERLSDDALEVVVRLAELPGDHGKLVRTILFAEPSLLDRLSGERFATAPKPHVLQLKPLDEGQLSSYLHHRLTAAGYAGGPLFSARDLKRIYKGGHGWPGGINAMAHEVLMDKLQAARPSRWRGLVIGGIVVGLAMGAYLALFTDRAAHTPGGAAAPVARPAVVQAAAEQPIVRYTAGAGAAHKALVVRGGETVQITCAAPLAAPTPRAAPALPAEGQPGVPSPLAEPPVVPAQPAAAEEPTAQAQAPKEVASPAAAQAEGEPAPPAAASAGPSPVSATAAGSEPAAPESAAPATTVEAAEPSASQGPAGEASATGVERSMAPESETSESSAAASQQAAPESAPATAAATQPSATPPAAQPALLPVIDRIEPNPVPGSLGRQVVTIHGQHFVPDSAVTVSWRGQHKTLAPSQVKVLDSERIAMEITTGIKAEAWSVTVGATDGRVSAPFRFQVSAPAQAAAAAAPKTTAATAPAQRAGGFRDADWLRSRESQRYTVQLVAATTRQAIRDHLQGYNVRGDLALLQTQRGGKPWFVVFWGDFADRGAAEQAVAALPAPLRRVSPWIRTFGDVHGEMKAGDVAAP